MKDSNKVDKKKWTEPTIEKLSFKKTLDGINFGSPESFTWDS